MSRGHSEKVENMPTDHDHNYDTQREEEPSGHSHTAIFAVLIAGLVIALAGTGYLLNRANSLNAQLTEMDQNTQGQISKLGDATSALLEQRVQALNAELADLKGTEAGARTALQQARNQAKKQSEQLASRIEDQQKQVADSISQLKESTDSTINAVSGDVSTVKTDVTGVKSDLATTKDGLEKTGADLKRVVGDMGVMSGLIATNSKDLDTLRTLGERNYIEFKLTKKEPGAKLPGVALTLKKADAGHNRYTVDVFADDKHVEKKDRTINEPVQVYMGNNRQPYEIVVNQVKKDEISGYVSTPKMTVARQ
jgi:hypothetical protein